LIKRFTPNITILYDGDAAGIRASFRGIDLILEEGMNVKVVPFPDGEDPDSYSQKVSSEELNEYLEQNAKDFISFKTNSVLAETQDDPIKKSALIREVIASIALVPNQISRSVYIKQTSQQFEIAEQTLISELNKILRNKHKKDRRGQGYADADTLDLIVPEKKLPEKQPTPGVELDYQEFDLIRLMLLYGSFGVQIEVESSVENEVEKAEIPVVQFILDELAESEISMTNDLTKLLMTEFQVAAGEGIIPDAKHFVNHEDQKISSCAVDLTADRHFLSENWTKMHNIYPETEEMKLQRAVEESVWIYKLRRVRLMKAELEVRLKSQLPAEEESSILKAIIKYNDIITVISNKLNIVVAK
jgi:DNA primase